jgi:hypothetical protein
MALALTIPPGAGVYADNIIGGFVKAVPGAYHAVQRGIAEPITAFNYGQANPRMIVGNGSTTGQLPTSLGILTAPPSKNDAALPPWVLLQ